MEILSQQSLLLAFSNLIPRKILKYTNISLEYRDRRLANTLVQVTDIDVSSFQAYGRGAPERGGKYWALAEECPVTDLVR